MSPDLHLSPSPRRLPAPAYAACYSLHSLHRDQTSAPLHQTSAPRSHPHRHAPRTTPASYFLSLHQPSSPLAPHFAPPPQPPAPSIPPRSHAPQPQPHHAVNPLAPFHAVSYLLALYLTPYHHLPSTASPHLHKTRSHHPLAHHQTPNVFAPFSSYRPPRQLHPQNMSHPYPYHHLFTLFIGYLILAASVLVPINLGRGFHVPQLRPAMPLARRISIHRSCGSTITRRIPSRHSMRLHRRCNRRWERAPECRTVHACRSWCVSHPGRTSDAQEESSLPKSASEDDSVIPVRWFLQSDGLSITRCITTRRQLCNLLPTGFQRFLAHEEHSVLVPLPRFDALFTLSTKSGMLRCHNQSLLWTGLRDVSAVAVSTPGNF